jgi:signal recognition particle subunit SRP19
LNLIDLPSHIPEKQLMIQVAELVPKHHGRTKKQEPAPNPGGSSKNTKGGKKKK